MLKRRILFFSACAMLSYGIFFSLLSVLHIQLFLKSPQKILFLASWLPHSARLPLLMVTLLLSLCASWGGIRFIQHPTSSSTFERFILLILILFDSITLCMTSLASPSLTWDPFYRLIYPPNGLAGTEMICVAMGLIYLPLLLWILFIFLQRPAKKTLATHIVLWIAAATLLTYRSGTLLYASYQKLKPIDSQIKAWNEKKRWEEMNRQALAVGEQGDLTAAVRMHERALAYASRLGNQEAMASSLNHLAVLAWKNKETKKAEDYFRKSIFAYAKEEKPDYFSKAMVFMLFAQFLREQNRPEDAVTWDNQVELTKNQLKEIAEQFKKKDEINAEIRARTFSEYSLLLSKLGKKDESEVWGRLARETLENHR